MQALLVSRGSNMILKKNQDNFANTAGSDSKISTLFQLYVKHDFRSSMHNALLLCCRPNAGATLKNLQDLP